MYHASPKYCNSCKEYIFAVEVLRHDTSSRNMISEAFTFFYCPFCGKEIKDEQEEKMASYFY